VKYLISFLKIQMYKLYKFLNLPTREAKAFKFNYIAHKGLDFWEISAIYRYAEFEPLSLIVLVSVL